MYLTRFRPHKIAFSPQPQTDKHLQPGQFLRKVDIWVWCLFSYLVDGANDDVIQNTKPNRVQPYFMEKFACQPSQGERADSLSDQVAALFSIIYFQNFFNSEGFGITNKKEHPF